MKIGFGCDHAAVEMKNTLMEHLTKAGHECVDFGTDSSEHRVDYPEKALAVAEAIKAGEIDKGVLCCGTGIGMCLAANKVPGIRASVCSEPYSAQLTVQHNRGRIFQGGVRGRPSCQPCEQDHRDRREVFQIVIASYDPRQLFSCREFFLTQNLG